MATDIELVEQAQADFTQIDEMARGSPVINLVNRLIQRAVREVPAIFILKVAAAVLFAVPIDGVLYECFDTRRFTSGYCSSA